MPLETSFSQGEPGTAGAHRIETSSGWVGIWSRTDLLERVSGQIRGPIFALGDRRSRTVSKTVAC